MSRLRVAVVGAGHLGRIHTRLLKSVEEVEVVGVVDPVAAARDQAASEFEVETFVHHDQLAGKIDAAVVATPTDQHCRVARDLLERGVHVLIEKPITKCVAEADELIARARANGRVLQAGHVERFNPAWAAVASYVRRPRYVEAVRTSGYTFRSIDVGVVLDLMIHDLDLALSIADSPLLEVDAVGAAVFGPHEDWAHAHLRFADGCRVTLNASRTSFEVRRQIQVITRRAYVGVDLAAGSARLVRPSPQVLRQELDVHRLSCEERDRVRQTLFTEVLPMEELRFEKRNAILDEQHEFLDSIRTGRPPRVSGEQARDCLAVAERILACIAAGDMRPGHRRDRAEEPARTIAPPLWQTIPARRMAG